jgi:hypothetical protein
MHLLYGAPKPEVDMTRTTVMLMMRRNHFLILGNGDTEELEGTRHSYLLIEGTQVDLVWEREEERDNHLSAMSIAPLECPLQIHPLQQRLHQPRLPLRDRESVARCNMPIRMLLSRLISFQELLRELLPVGREMIIRIRVIGDMFSER